MANENTVNVLDYISVENGRVHNVGAGGVNLVGGVDCGTISHDRFDQFCKRTDRACGHEVKHNGYKS